VRFVSRTAAWVSSVAVLLGAACVKPSSSDRPPADATPSAGEEHSPASVVPSPIPAHPIRPQLDGTNFPPKVLALTWDDGPDRDTLALADYLHKKRIAATFFVVHSWVEGVSSDPGSGPFVFKTGYGRIPILAQLIQLGHRVGNHTYNHALLTELSPPEIEDQLRKNQQNLDPFQSNGLHLFRVPGGAWDEAASFAVDGDPALRELIGPVRWDIDAKDWEASLSCASADGGDECERDAGGTEEIKPPVVAKRYLAAVDAVGHGIVLLHDRVGRVGTRYALELAHALVPLLERRGYVFSAPVLSFSPPTHRDARPDAIRSPPGTSALTGDLNGDGRPDQCTRLSGAIECALASAQGLLQPTVWLRFEGPAAPFAASRPLKLVDVNGDGRADLCGEDDNGLLCSLAP
jgi:peptidoglycan/xylan/chitin deacetylase (PgdA/CDA1 family)